MIFEVHRSYNKEAKSFIKKFETNSHSNMLCEDMYKFDKAYDAIDFICDSIDAMNEMFDACSIEFERKQPAMCISVFVAGKLKFTFNYDMNTRRFMRYALWAIEGGTC